MTIRPIRVTNGTGGAVVQGVTPMTRRSDGQTSPAAESGDDKVFEQATGMLWNPLAGPPLRPALFRVLATTPGTRTSTVPPNPYGG